MPEDDLPNGFTARHYESLWRGLEVEYGKRFAEQIELKQGTRHES